MKIVYLLFIDLNLVCKEYTNELNLLISSDVKRLDIICNDPEADTSTSGSIVIFVIEKKQNKLKKREANRDLLVDFYSVKRRFIFPIYVYVA